MLLYIKENHLPETHCGFRESNYTDDTVYIRYSPDGSLFSLKKLLAHSMTLLQLFQDLLFVHSEKALQHLTSGLAEATQLFRLKVS